MATITLLGSGNMARGIATRALAGGYGVELLARDADQAEALAGELRAAATGEVQVSTGAIGDTPAGDLVVLAVPYEAALELVERHSDALALRVLVDITNPLKQTMDGLATPPGTSAAEQIAAAAPAGARVVKAWNTTFAGTLVAGQVDGQPVDVFIAGDDAEAKALVAGVVVSGGCRPIDVGALDAAGALEAFQYLHIGLQFSRGTGFRTAIKLLG